MKLQSTKRHMTQTLVERVRRGRHALMALGLGSTLLSGAAQAGDHGFRVELSPLMSYAKQTATTDRYLAAGAQLQAELWGLGPFGVMFKAGENAQLTQVELTDAGIVPMTTYVAQAMVGPTLNFKLGPLAHVRVGGGPRIGYQWFSEKSLSELSAQGLVPAFDKAVLLGSSLEGRVDLNLPIISPFVAVEGRTHTANGAEDASGQSVMLEGVELTGTAGIRLNVIPLVKLSLAGQAGYTHNVYNYEVPTTNDLTHFGVSVGLVVMR